MKIELILLPRHRQTGELLPKEERFSGFAYPFMFGDETSTQGLGFLEEFNKLMGRSIVDRQLAKLRLLGLLPPETINAVNAVNAVEREVVLNTWDCDMSWGREAWVEYRQRCMEAKVPHEVKASMRLRKPALIAYLACKDWHGAK